MFRLHVCYSCQLSLFKQFKKSAFGIGCSLIKKNRTGSFIPTTFKKMTSSLCDASQPPPLSPPPVVVVLGSTASGKSKLAIDLAKRVPGEIISADSMQVYEGLDILTNKATQEEMQGVPHHMIGVVDRSVKFDVTKFREMALPLVDKILAEGKVPYIVGGTNYYIESLLWKILIDEDNSSLQPSDYESASDTESPAKRLKLSDVDVSNPILSFALEKKGYFTEQELMERWSVKELYESLQQIDPIRASKFHPNDLRKIVRSLQVYFRTGRKHSEIIEEQCNEKEEEKGNSENDAGVDTEEVPKSLQRKLGGPLRYSNCVCFWIQADRDILNRRIDDRVDKMIGHGLRKELDDYVDQINLENRKWDFQEGQLQSIGVKEFQSYIQLLSEDRDTEQGQKLFAEGIERLKIVTRQYAKRQVQWVTQRFLKSSRRQLPPVYGLDGNDVSEESWKKHILNPAFEILNAHLQGNSQSPLLKEKRLPVQDEDELANDLIMRRCDICDKYLVGSSQYEIHMKSAKHWKMVKRKQRLDARNKLEAEDQDNEEVRCTLEGNI